MSAPNPHDLDQCLLCGGTPAQCFLSLPPRDRVMKKANGQCLAYTLCTDCRGLPDACEQIDQALRARGQSS